MVLAPMCASISRTLRVSGAGRKSYLVLGDVLRDLDGVVADRPKRRRADPSRRNNSWLLPIAKPRKPNVCSCLRVGQAATICSCRKRCKVARMKSTARAAVIGHRRRVGGSAGARRPVGRRGLEASAAGCAADVHRRHGDGAARAESLWRPEGPGRIGRRLRHSRRRAARRQAGPGASRFVVGRARHRVRVDHRGRAADRRGASRPSSPAR